jgi:tetratricopeptide (TPR) repeat protein
MAFYNRGIVKGRLNDFSGALADYSTALTLNPEYANAYGNRGLMKKELQDLQGALADYNKALDTVNKG